MAAIANLPCVSKQPKKETAQTKSVLTVEHKLVL